NIRYARAENVKASSTLIAADQIVHELTQLGLIANDTAEDRRRYAHEWTYLVHNDSTAVDNVARVLAEERGFPQAMAGVNRSIREATLANLASNTI
ncbi:FAD-dependent oxidoreductase, partial [Psychrobacter sp. 1U2]